MNNRRALMIDKKRPESSGLCLIALPVNAGVGGAIGSPLEIYRLAYEQAQQATIRTPLDFARQVSLN